LEKEGQGWTEFMLTAAIEKELGVGGERLGNTAKM
jgi:hypothetical protein